MDFPTLYTRNKDNSIQSWTIKTNGSDIITQFGKLNGKMQTATKIAESKNIGQKNETTPAQQAELEAHSMWQKKMDQGYFEAIAAAFKGEVFLPMLAHKLEKKEKLEFPLFLQPKMDGVRCLSHWNNGRIVLLSRGGKEYTVSHITKQLETLLPKDTVFDGELYIHGLPRQDLQALVKKPREEVYGTTGKKSSDIQYWVYDCFKRGEQNTPYALRKVYLSNILHQEHGPIRRVYTHEIHSLQQLEKLHKYFNRNGFEGTIIRLPDGKYELAQRSRNLLKYKDFQDAEFKIIGASEGNGKFKGCVIWKCATESGKKFDVVPKGTLEQKKGWFKNKEDFINKMLTVKFQSFSNDGIPEFPVGLGIRLEEDR